MEVSNDLILNAINDNTVEVAKLRERVDAMLATHAETKLNQGRRIAKVEKRQMVAFLASLAACLLVVVNSGKGANILSALISMFN